MTVKNVDTSPVQLPYYKSSHNLEPLHIALSKKDFLHVIRNSELFWIAFCKEASHLKKVNAFSFYTSISGNKITVAGIKNNISEIKKIVEFVRNFFVKGIEKKRDFTIVPININYHYFIYEKQAGTIDLTKWLSNDSSKIFHRWFDCYVRPCIYGLSKVLGITASEELVFQRYIYEKLLGTMTESFYSIKIELNLDKRYVYLIPHKSIPKRDDIQKSMYSMYKNQTLCNVSLAAKDGSLNVHSMPLFIHGGTVMQTMLTSKMKESVEQTISLKEYSLNTVRAFVEFIYLGVEGLEPDIIRKNKVNLVELFKMAHFYLNQPLIDHCTNLFSIFSTEDDVATIYELSNKYENEHLKELYNYFSSKAKEDYAESVDH